MRSLILLAALACGGAPTTQIFVSPPAPLASTQGPAELLAALQDAGDAWLAAGVEPVWIEQIEWTPKEQMAKTCGYSDGTPVLACAHGPRIYVRVGLDADPRYLGIITHELGHSIRQANGGAGGHLPCASTPGDALMCDGGNDDLAITDRDVAFVRGE